ncbi:Hsp20/alpha crystallin family protein [Hymenobacter rubripertinctus]|uniref:Hsp20/alpha crystallin family protein n=1 Tax=Hymenobacter rubripertinctus TaxID=2029981 RepID=A0A418R9S1_9BACT|nr:Hsp20/alpha crystallin family protein [Hymenobacter rubripertinctus]RIY14156.1 Hsp20/alpha crystallin family protein [Hymenobacter rubripertinctus]
MATLLYNNRPARTSFNSVLNEMLRDTLPAQNKPAESFSPAADVLESSEGFQLHLMLPGVAKEDVQIDFQDGQLTVSGERKAPKAAENATGNAPAFRRVESGYGKFARTFRLPDTVDVTGIGAELTNGILHLSLPFDSKKVTKHQIEVR